MRSVEDIPCWEKIRDFDNATYHYRFLGYVHPSGWTTDIWVWYVSRYVTHRQIALVTSHVVAKDWESIVVMYKGEILNRYDQLDEAIACAVLRQSNI